MRKRLLAIIAVAAMLVTMVPAMAFAAGETTLPSEMSGTWGGGEKTVYYDGNYYDTLQEALAAVYESTPSGTAKVYCKPDANVGAMSHAHVADSVTIYGNGATVAPGGDQDMEVDMFKFDRSDGVHQNSAGTTLDKDITITVDDLGGIAVWGSRTTDHTINVIFQNCENVHKIFIMGTTGTNNITVTNCSFDVAKGSLRNTGIFSNAPGEITIENTAFKGVAVPINLNNKTAGGKQVVKVIDSTFTDCATPDIAAAENAASYAAPIRVVNSAGESVELIVDGCTFNYTSDEPANGDILVGNGSGANGVVAEVTNTDANLKVHEQSGVSEATTVTADKKLTIDEAGVVKVTENAAGGGETPTPEVPGGNGTPDSDKKPEDATNTGDDFNMLFPMAAAGLALAAMAAVVTAGRREY